MRRCSMFTARGGKPTRSPDDPPQTPVDCPSSPRPKLAPGSPDRGRPGRCGYHFVERLRLRALSAAADSASAAGDNVRQLLGPAGSRRGTGPSAPVRRGVRGPAGCATRWPTPDTTGALGERPARCPALREAPSPA